MQEVLDERILLIPAVDRRGGFLGGSIDSVQRRVHHVDAGGRGLRRDGACLGVACLYGRQSYEVVVGVAQTFTYRSASPVLPLMTNEDAVLAGSSRMIRTRSFV